MRNDFSTEIGCLNVSGYVMDQFDNQKEGLIWGYRLILGWNVFTMVFLGLAMFFSWRRSRQIYGGSKEERSDLILGELRPSTGYEDLTHKEVEQVRRERIHSVNKVM